MGEPTLTTLIANAARSAFSELFGSTQEDYYYCTLFTTGEGLAPYLSAWSWQALERASAEFKDPAKAAAMLKWSYADSPYCVFGEEHFAAVEQRFEEMPQLHELSSTRRYRRELNSRLDAMTSAMALLDQEGLFGTGERRANLVVLAEVVPPDKTNTVRAKRLNRRGSPGLTAWLNEAAE